MSGPSRREEQDGRPRQPAAVKPFGPNASGGAGVGEIAVYSGQMLLPDAAFIVGCYYVPGVGMVEVWARRAALFPWERPGMEPPPEGTLHDSQFFGFQSVPDGQCIFGVVSE